MFDLLGDSGEVRYLNLESMFVKISVVARIQNEHDVL